MRWRLLIITSLLATFIGTGATLAIVRGLLGSAQPLTTPDLLIASTLLIPVAAITFASIFVYRHTSRRRQLQAMLTALIAGLLTLTLLTLSSILMAEPAPSVPPPVPTPRNIG